MDPYQTAPLGAVWSGSKLFACLLTLLVCNASNYMQQTTLTDDTFYALFRSRRRPEGLIFNNKWCYSEACSRVQLNYGDSPASLRCGPWARHIYPSLVLVQPRKTRPYITERLLMGRKESNQTNKKQTTVKVFLRFALFILIRSSLVRAFAACTNNIGDIESVLGL